MPSAPKDVGLKEKELFEAVGAEDITRVRAVLALPIRIPSAQNVQGQGHVPHEQGGGVMSLRVAHRLPEVRLADRFQQGSGAAQQGLDGTGHVDVRHGPAFTWKVLEGEA
jgi:hypothetical protein